MSLFQAWKDTAYIDRDQEAYNAFWGAYLPKEQAIYEELLSKPDQAIQGTIHDLATRFDMDTATFVGFLDGINTSLVEEMDLDSLSESSVITINVDLKNLYYNMLDANADWLYNLPAWDGLLSLAERKEIKKAYNATKTIVKDKKVGRNEPCPCGSGKKYKQCCINK